MTVTPITSDKQNHYTQLASARRFMAKAPGYEIARTILGKDFITPKEIAKSRGLVYTHEQLLTFGETLPAQDVLEWCRDNGYMLVAGPPKAMSLLDIRLHAPYFNSKEGVWYAESDQAFSRDDKATTVWIMLRKEPCPESFKKNQEEQQSLLSKVEYVPNAAEVVWALTTYNVVRGVYLLPRLYVRTSSRDSDGCRVSVGFFDGEGLSVYHCWDDDCNLFLGVVSALILESLRARPS